MLADRRREVRSISLLGAPEHAGYFADRRTRFSPNPLRCALEKRERLRRALKGCLLLADLLGDLGGQIADLLLEAVAHLVAGEGDDLRAGRLLLDHLAHAGLAVLDEHLLQQADFLV